MKKTIFLLMLLSPLFLVNPAHSYESQPYARSTDRRTGVTTTKRKHSDGSYTIIKRDRYGRILGQRHVLSRRSGGGRVNQPYARSTDRRTGTTTTKRVHSDGSYTIIQRDRYGRIIGQRHVLSRRSGGGRVNQPYARSTDRSTGVTTTKTRNSDGSFTVIKRHSNGRIIGVRNVRG
ncbi:MAG: hypothetical protein BMS9Abin11_1604 [Gammaproteobacteria bacterium]|nr:MAG: hypothetical protein BMS9Abin11_1604 [Gammaproteobacteria bacterium]